MIAAYPEGGGAYAVAKANLGRWPSLLAAAAVVVDYVLTVAVSLAAGAASLGSVFPALSHHLLLVIARRAAILTTVNMFGIAESARLLMLPTAIFIVSILAMIVVGALRSHPVAHDRSHDALPRTTETVGILLLLKAFAPAARRSPGSRRSPTACRRSANRRVRTAQRTEISLGVLLGVMLIGLVLYPRPPRGAARRRDVLAQVTAGAFGTGWAFYVSNIAVALVLGLAANTSFGGLPVLISLLARDNRLPHVFYLRAERPVYRIGIVALSLAAALLLVAVEAKTNDLIPLFTIGVFVGFTLSQIGLVRHWSQRAPGALAAAGGGERDRRGR